MISSDNQKYCGNCIGFYLGIVYLTSVASLVALVMGSYCLANNAYSICGNHDGAVVMVICSCILFCCGGVKVVTQHIRNEENPIPS
jgi:hypothetical protein